MGAGVPVAVRKALCAAAVLAACLWASSWAEGREVLTVRAARPSQEIGASTSEVLVFLGSGSDAESYARDHGLMLRYSLRSDASACVFDAGSAGAASRLVRGAGSDARVRSAWLNQPAPAATMSYTPNDPYFHYNTPSAGWPGQWYLKNEAWPGIDARVQGAWDRGLDGAGVVVGIIDTGFESTHPDLAGNYVAADSWDFGQNDALADPVVSDDNHATAVAGIVAARGGNGIGITGAAPRAGLASLRCDFWSPGTTAQFVDATLYHSSGANTSIGVKNHSYGYTQFHVTAEEQNALQVSAQAGTIHVFSASNSGMDANKRDLQNSWGAITVAALDNSGIYADYSDFGANVFVCAPSSSFTLGVTTTDRQGLNGYNPKLGDTFPDTDYTSIFGGTSAAAPIVSGVMALGKSIRPNMDERFAKHLLVHSCDIVDPADCTPWSDGGWKTNGAGYQFNQNYGFGLINADRFTQLAAFFTGVSPLQTENISTVGVHQAIPDANLNGISRTFDVVSITPLEEVLVTLDITHQFRGDLEACLTSPEGTTSRLFLRDLGDDAPDIHWTFLTNAFWGEDPAGQWTLKVMDMFIDFTGTWDSYSVELRMGELVPEPATAALFLLGGLLAAARCRRRK